MSEIKYGLISKVDASVIEKTLDLILAANKDEVINVTEIGLFDCGTAIGICDYLRSKDATFCYTGIDNEKDKPIQPPPYINYIKGNSNEVYHKLENNSQHLIFVDSCHCFAHVISDFFCYEPKVKAESYLIFHDTGTQIKQLKDFQHGDKDNPDAYISVRKALKSIAKFGVFTFKWVLIFDEADKKDEAGGVCVFQKMYL